MDPHPLARDNTERQAAEGLSAACRWLLIGTLGIAVIEWLMFELLRAPYRPPWDMRTALGQEKYDLVGLMCVVAAVWLLSTITLLILERLTKRDYIAFVALLVAICATYALIIANPPWPVTPWNYILT